MKSKNFIAGILILFIGVVALLAALNVFDFHWSIVMRLWPMILIILGISILPLNDYLKGTLILVSLGIGCLLYHVEAKDYKGNTISRFFNSAKSWRYDDDEDEADDEEAFPFDQHFSEPYSSVERASIDIDFGAGDLELKAPCAELVKVDAQSNFMKYSFRTEYAEDGTNIFVTGSGHTDHLGKKTENDLEIALCDAPVWSFNLDMGAADADLDFSPYKVSSLVINGGACELDLKLGNSGCDTKVEIETGASDIDIKVPEGVDCEVNIESAISGKDLIGFEKVDRGLWRTPGFGQGTNKIVINIDCAISDISVERY